MIFNLWAIPVGLLIYGLTLALEWLVPGLATEAAKPIVFGATATVVGAITEFFGIKARVFFLPIWLIGIGVLCYQLGWAGMIPFSAVAGLALYGLWQGALKMEAKEWEKAQRSWRENQVPPAGASEPEFWEWIQSVLHLPIGGRCTRPICDHNRSVLKTLTADPALLIPTEAAHVHELSLFFEQASVANEPPELPLPLRESITSLIEARLKQARKARRQQKWSSAAAPTKSGKSA